MRVTNNMIMQNSIKNINGTKEQTSKLNDQMTSQKKITKASDDPVIAIRSLRLRNTQSQINQYYDNNISDAEVWLDNTETSLTNMKSVLNDIYVLCNDATNGDMTAENRKTVLSSLESLRDEVYSEGNSEYAGRTLFTGYKTSSTLTFLQDDSEKTYSITENLSYSDISQKSYYADSVSVPSDLTGMDSTTTIDSPTQVDNYRLRLSYDDLTSATATDSSFALTITSDGTTYTKAADNTFVDSSGNKLQYTDSSGNLQDYTFSTKSYSDWEADDFSVEDGEVVYVPETGELVLGNAVAKDLKSNKSSLSVTYDKTGFQSGEVKPEFYFDCVDTTDAQNPITYTKQDQDINYTISANTTLTVNTQASDLFGTEIGRDIDEMINAVNSAIAAQDKVSQIETLQSSSEYADDEDAQAYLSNLLTAANKELDYANDNMENLLSDGVGNFTGYVNDIALAITDVGNKGDRLDLVKTRMADQQSTIKTLISNNENKDLSEIVIEYTASYNAYQSALLAASKASSNTLLDYL